MPLKPAHKVSRGLLEDRGLVGRQHHGELGVEVRLHLAQRGLEVDEVAVGRRPAELLKCLEEAAEHHDLVRTCGMPETLLDEGEPVGLELLRLGEHRLADPNLAEVVQQRRVAQLCHLVAGETQAPERLRWLLLHRSCQRGRVVGHAQGVA